MSLNNIASCLPGPRIRGNRVDFVAPSACHHKGYKKKRRTASAYLNANGHFYIICSHPDDGQHVALEIKREIERRLGLGWKPKPRGPRKPFRPGIDYYAATRRLCLDRGTITQEQFAILVNDIIETEPTHRAAVARTLATEFGFPTTQTNHCGRTLQHLPHHP
jgi:hypothetical protein